MVGSIQPRQWRHIRYKHYLDPEQPCGHSVYPLTKLFTKPSLCPSVGKSWHLVEVSLA